MSLNQIEQLQPQAVWKHFAALCAIPRPSHHEAAVSQYIQDFGKKLNLETWSDQAGNVVIRKSATAGMEDKKTVVLQGHVDLVPQKDKDSAHDFEKDPIDAYIDGEWVTAKGTTLGADNGLGVAMAMALLEATDVAHPAIEALFTVNEEDGMEGVTYLKEGLIKGDILLNLDSECDDELCVGCAGGVDTDVRFHFKKESIPAGHIGFQLNVSGLKGGHSGMDISLGRGNAIKILDRLLWKGIHEFGLRLTDIHGGTAVHNAIPRDAHATVTIPTDQKSAFLDYIAQMDAAVKNELQAVEPDASVTIKETNLPSFVMDTDTASRLILAIRGCFNGVARMSQDMEGLIETSSNLGYINTDNETVLIYTLQRSAIDTAKEAISQSVEAIFRLAGAELSHANGYPGWKPNMDSAILATMKNIYKEQFGEDVKIMATHGGLECGFLGALYPQLDMISMGATIRFPHSPDEKMNIPSVAKTWQFFVEVLKNIPKK